MAIYITGDTHGGANEIKLYSKNFPDYNQCTKNDVVIIAGDWGYIYQNESRKDRIEIEKNKMKATFQNRKWGTTLFVDGNHENFDRLEKFPIIEMFGGKVRKIDEDIYQLLRGEIYVIDGKKILAFGGARSIDALQLQEGFSWWKGELCTYEEIENAFNNLEKHNYEVDYIITHTCSASSLQYICQYYKMYLEEFDAYNKLFEEFKYRVNYQKWYFGHFHQDLNINDKENVIFDKILKLGEDIPTKVHSLLDDMKKVKP